MQGINSQTCKNPNVPLFYLAFPCADKRDIFSLFAGDDVKCEFPVEPPSLASTTVSDRDVALINGQKTIGICINVSSVMQSLGDEISSYNIMNSLALMGFKGSFTVFYSCPCCEEGGRIFPFDKLFIKYKFVKLFTNYDVDNNEGTFECFNGNMNKIRFFHLGDLYENKKILQEVIRMNVQLLFSGIGTDRYDVLCKIGVVGSIVGSIVGITSYQWNVEQRYTLLRTSLSIDNVITKYDRKLYTYIKFNNASSICK